LIYLENLRFYLCNWDFVTWWPQKYQFNICSVHLLKVLVLDTRFWLHKILINSLLRGCLVHVFLFSFAYFTLVGCCVIAGICSGYLIFMPCVFLLASSHLMCVLLQIDLRRANNCGIMLTKVKMPLPDLMVKQ
jgi:hypothetical protein